MISFSSSSSSFSSFEDLLHQANIVLPHPIPVENLQQMNLINQVNIKFRDLGYIKMMEIILHRKRRTCFLNDYSYVTNREFIRGKDSENDRDDDKQNDDNEQDRSVALLTTGSTSLGYCHFDLIF